MRTHRPWILVACLLLLGTLVAIAAQGCGPQLQPDCPYNDGSGRYGPFCLQCAADGTIKGCNECVVDPDLGPSFACSRDGGKDAATDSAITDGGATGCAGDCVPAPPFGWGGPGLFWTGTDGTAPACPSNAPVTAYQGHDGLVLPDAGCAPCTCAGPSPSGSCAPPLQITASASPCVASAPAARDFGPPPAWDGACTTFDAIPAGALCNGAPCAVSLTSGPLVLTESMCKPSDAALVDAGLPTWSKKILACQNDAPYPPGCKGLYCSPRAAEAPGFLSCIFQKGDNDCPAPYLDKHVAYTSFDPPGCAPCLCGPPDSSCTGTLDVFEDAGCSAKAKPLLTFDHLSNVGSLCHDLPDAGVALGSKRLVLAYDAGTCTPSGGGSTDAGPAGASTFCCLVS